MPLSPQYVLGRFHAVRQTYSFYQRIQQSINPTREIYIGNKYDSKTLASVDDTSDNVYFEHSSEEFAREVEQNAYSFGISLDREVVEKIVDYSKTAWLEPSLESQQLFKFDDVEGNTSNESKVAIGTVRDAYLMPEIRSIALNSKLVALASNCLGYYPEHINTWLFWSFADTLSEQERRAQYQTIDFHYDIHGLNFLYINFYLTDTTKETGAHVLVKASHKDKKIKFLLGSARLSDSEVINYYGKDNVLTIEGSAGLGFVEDTSCYHKALSPIAGNRLMLQLRYY
jgi:hypothetical protein